MSVSLVINFSDGATVDVTVEEFDPIARIRTLVAVARDVAPSRITLVCQGETLQDSDTVEERNLDMSSSLTAFVTTVAPSGAGADAEDAFEVAIFSPAKNKKITISVHAEMTVAEIKLLLEAEHEGGAPELQRLVLNGMALADGTTASESEMDEASVVTWLQMIPSATTEDDTTDVAVHVRLNDEETSVPMRVVLDWDVPTAVRFIVAAHPRLDAVDGVTIIVDDEALDDESLLDEADINEGSTIVIQCASARPPAADAAADPWKLQTLVRTAGVRSAAIAPTTRFLQKLLLGASDDDLGRLVQLDADGALGAMDATVHGALLPQIEALRTACLLATGTADVVVQTMRDVRSVTISFRAEETVLTFKLRCLRATGCNPTWMQLMCGGSRIDDEDEREQGGALTMAAYGVGAATVLQLLESEPRRAIPVHPQRTSSASATAVASLPAPPPLPSAPSAATSGGDASLIPLASLTVEQVSMFLNSHKLGVFVETFKENDVEGEMLEQDIKTLDDIDEFEVGKKIQRKKLLRVVDKCRKAGGVERARIEIKSPTAPTVAAPAVAAVPVAAVAVAAEEVPVAVAAVPVAAAAPLARPASPPTPSAPPMPMCIVGGAVLTTTNASIGAAVTTEKLFEGGKTGRGTLLGWKVAGNRFGDTTGGLSSDNYCRVDFADGGPWNVKMCDISLVGGTPAAASASAASGSVPPADGSWVWSSAGKGTNITLSDGNSVFEVGSRSGSSSSGSTTEGARGSVGWTSGTHAWVLRFDSGTGSHGAVGLCTGAHTLFQDSYTHALGNDTHSWGWHKDGAVYFNGKEVARTETFTEGDRLTLELDLTGNLGTLTLCKGSAAPCYTLRGIRKDVPLYPAAVTPMASGKVRVVDSMATPSGTTVPGGDEDVWWWEWEDGVDGSGEWKSFDAAAQAQLASTGSALAGGGGARLALTFGSTVYTCDTSACTQTNTSTSYVRKIRRVVKRAPAASAAATGTTCPAGHVLTSFQTPRPGFGCDLCKSSKAVGETMFGCRGCNYDLCSSCHTAAEGAPSAGTPVTDTNKALGLRVKRGPEWKWQSQDGGGMGTIVELDSPGWVKIKWDANGKSNSYRTSAQDLIFTETERPSRLRPYGLVKLAGSSKPRRGLEVGEVGVIVKDDEDSRPFKVVVLNTGEETDFYKVAELVAVAPESGRATVGDYVVLSGASSKSNGLAIGERGRIVKDDNDSRPYKVQTRAGTSDYYRESELWKVAAPVVAASSTAAPTSSSGVPRCPTSGHAMCISSGAGHYADYICNSCRGHKSGERWFCSTCRDDFCFACSPKSLGGSSSPIRVGDRVRVKASVTSPAHGWGSVSAGDFGTVVSISGTGVKVDFPKQSGWSGKLAEMEKNGGDSGVRARPVVGDQVRLTSDFASHGDASGGPLAVGATGVLVQDDASTKPFKVKVGDREWWYKEGAIEKCVAASGASSSSSGAVLRYKMVSANIASGGLRVRKTMSLTSAHVASVEWSAFPDDTIRVAEVRGDWVKVHPGEYSTMRSSRSFQAHDPATEGWCCWTLGGKVLLQQVSA